MSIPILELLKDKTKAEIKELLGHYDKVAEHEQHEIEFKQLKRGAEVVLNIIKSDPICSQGTTNFLKTLDREQLQYALDKGAEILKEKTSLGKALLYGVFGGSDGSKWFHDKELAKAYYLVAAQESLEDYYPKVTFEKRKVPLEELHEYLSVNEATKIVNSINTSK